MATKDFIYFINGCMNFEFFLNLAKLFRKKQEEVGEGVFVKCQYFPIEN